MNREKVYERLDGERDYQDIKWNSPNNKGSLDRTVDEFATYIQHYSNHLINVAAMTDNDKEKLEVIRKIGALAVACGEAHGLPERENG